MQLWQPVAASVTISGGVTVNQTSAAAVLNADSAVNLNQAFAQTAVAAGVAAQTTSVIVSNPNASGKTFYVDAFRVRSSVAGESIAVIPGVVGEGALSSTLQCRRIGGARSTTQLRTGNNLDAGSDTLDQFSVPTGNVDGPLTVLDHPIQLPPNTAVAFRSTNVNTTLTVSVYGREY